MAKTTSVLAATVLAGGLAIGGAAAQDTLAPALGPGTGPVARLLQRHLHEFGLSGEQQEQVLGILASHRDEFQAGLQRLKAAHLGLQAPAAGVLDEATAQVQARELGEAVADLALLKTRVQSEVRAVLTAEQRQRADARHARLHRRLERLAKLFRAFVLEDGEERS